MAEQCHSHYSDDGQQERRRLGHGGSAPRAAAGMVAEIRFPQVIIAGVDLVVAVAVGGKISRRAERVAPYGVVSGVDDTIVVEVAQKAT